MIVEPIDGLDQVLFDNRPAPFMELMNPSGLGDFLEAFLWLLYQDFLLYDMGASIQFKGQVS